MAPPDVTRPIHPIAHCNVLDGGGACDAGLATDFCVAWTAMDARHAGLTTYVVEDACRGIDINGSMTKAWKDMTAAGDKKIQSSDLAA